MLKQEASARWRSTKSHHALEIRGGADRRGKRLERTPRSLIADIRMQHHVARWKRRQSEPRADIDRSRGRDPAAERRDGKTGGDRGAGGGDAAADEALGPAEAGTLRRVDAH